MGLGTRLVDVTHYAVVLETEVQPFQVLLHVTGHYITSSWHNGVPVVDALHGVCMKCLQCL